MTAGVSQTSIRSVPHDSAVTSNRTAAGVLTGCKAKLLIAAGMCLAPQGYHGPLAHQGKAWTAWHVFARLQIQFRAIENVTIKYHRQLWSFI
jgi:hypothetical protein